MDAKDIIKLWRSGQRINAGLVVDTYNQMFNAKERKTNCSRCLNRMLAEIEKHENREN
jgi:hypothetical protein